VALIDQTSFSKFRITGDDALSFVQRVAVADVDKPMGSLVYTQLCNHKGGIEADLTFMREGQNEFYMVTGTAFGDHDQAWLNKNLRENENVSIKKVTHQYGVLNVCGPNARKLLSEVTTSDISHENLAFGTYQDIEVAGITLKAARITYVGELGWELHIPIAGMKAVYDAMWNQGYKYGVANAGYRAIESCRLEKGYRYWSSDLTPDYTPYEGGLGFCIAKDKSGYVGEEALRKLKAEGPKRRLITLTFGKEVHLLGKECILHKGKVVGVLTSGGFGYTIGKNIGFGYVPSAFVFEDGYEIECLGKVYEAERIKGAAYDPKRANILC
jgi:4-methylaminobutanoate oxidase (formaldehyde-forming)